MQIPFFTDSLDTQLSLIPYMMRYEHSMQSNFDIDTTMTNSKRIESQIHNLHDNICVNDIGYSDIVSVISIPLIIALFAFSFPFIFQTINHINDKYASKHISTLFRTSIKHKLFWIINSLSIIYVIAYGACSLLWKEGFFVKYSQLWSWIMIFVAFAHACIVMVFVWYCINFNNPDKLFIIIKRRYHIEKFIVKLQQKWVLCKVLLRSCFHYKDKAGNTIYKSARDMVCRWQNSVPEDCFVSRLIGVARFAVKGNDFSLFQNVLYSLDNIIDTERSSCSREQKDDVIKESSVHYRTMRFFDELLITYKPIPNAFMQNESIIFKMVGAFDRTKYMSNADSFRLAICMRKMLDYGNEALLEKYIDYTQHYFKYLLYLPKVFYIKGGLTKNRDYVEKRSVNSWNYLCCFHYAVLAYAFDKCKYSLLKIHLEKNHYSDYNLYPKTGADVLIRYAYCVNNICFLNDNKLFERRVDVKSLLRKYTAILLLLIPETEEIGYPMLENEPKKIIDTIDSSKSDLEKEMNIIKTNTTLLNLYPNLANTNSSKRFSYFLDVIKMFLTPSASREIEGNKECSTLSLVHSFIGRLLEKTTPNKTRTRRTNLYTQKLNKKITDDFASRFNQLNNDLSHFLPNGLFSSDSYGKNDEVFLNPCQLRIDKLYFLDMEYYSGGYDLYREYVEQFATRLIYLALFSFRKMKLKEVNIKSPNFDIFFEKFTRGKRENFVLIGIDSPFEAILNITLNGRDMSYRKTTPYVNISSSRNPLLTDLDDYTYFKDSILVVAKKDLPKIVDIGENKDIMIDHKDCSDESNMQLSVRTTIDVHKKLIFNPNAKIAMVRLKRMNM